MANTLNLGSTKPVSEYDAQKVVTYNTLADDYDATIAGYLSKSVAGTGNKLLTRADALHAWFKFTGVLTGNVVVQIPATLGAARVLPVWNATTGAFSLTVKMSTGGTGVVVTQGKKVILVQDGSEVYAVSAEV